MKSIWSGSISFGLVNIPINLYSAHATAHEINFDMLHKKDLSPVRYAKMCRMENAEIPFEEITKGIDMGGGNYIEINQNDFDKAYPKRTKTIEIINFCNQEEIDPIYFEKPYYLEPSKQSDKPYQLLFSALAKTKKIGIAKFVLRAREHLAMLRPYKGILMLIQLRYEDEISDLSKMRFPMKVALSEDEQNLAEKLIDQVTKPFEPHNFEDTFKKEMKKIIKSKAEGKNITAKEHEPAPQEMANLIETLSRSLDRNKR